MYMSTVTLLNGNEEWEVYLSVPEDEEVFKEFVILADRMTLEKAFAVLPEDSCRIIMLHAVSGMKHREIAELLNMPISTVLSKYNRGIKKLQTELERML